MKRLYLLLSLAFMTGCAPRVIRAPASASEVPGFSLEAPAESAPQVGTFLDEVRGVLPARIQLALGRPVQVRFVKLDSHILGRTPGRSPKQGRPFRVELNESLRSAVVSGDRAAKRRAQSALIHEIAHLYDFLNLLPESEALELHRCDVVSADARCTELRSLQGTISDREPYRSLAGWKKGWLEPRPKNLSRARSADEYEFKDLYEHFAVNFEFFLLDPEFACRRPALHQFFVERFGHEPFRERPCRPNTEVRLALSGLSAQIDPDRVYEIHYLLAGRGEGLASRWGHAMLRIVMCAPERTQVGPECLQDIVHHLVVSYRANVYDFTLDALGSLNGKYPLQLYFYRMPEIVDDYTRTQLRELKSVPLSLTAEQRRLFVHQAIEQYWSYMGQYYFLTNNCATEARDFVRSVVPPESELRFSSAVTPYALLSDLVAAGLSDGDLLRKLGRGEAARRGLYFPSQKATLADAFGRIKHTGRIGPGLGTVDDYLRRSAAQERRRYFDRLEEMEPRRRQAVAASFYLLERQIQRRVVRETQEEAAKLLSGAELLAPLDRARELQQKLLPWNRIRADARYGIPFKDELVPRSEIGAIEEQIHSLLSGFRKTMKETLQEKSKEAQEISENLKLLLSETGAGTDR